MIYILLPVHNRVSITLEFIDCLRKQSYTSYQLILIDDGSTDNTAEAVCARVDDTVVLNGDGSLWWAGCLNRGIDWLSDSNVDSESIVLMINDDVVFNDDFLQMGKDLIEQSEHTLLLARQLDAETGEIIETGIHADWNILTFTRAKPQQTISCLSTRGLFMVWKDLLAIGPIT